MKKQVFLCIAILMIAFIACTIANGQTDVEQPQLSPSERFELLALKWSHPNLPLEELQKGAKNPDPIIRGYVAGHLKTPVATRNILAFDKVAQVRAKAAPYITDLGVQKQLLQDVDSTVCVALATNQYLFIEVQALLIHHRFEIVRSTFAGNRIIDMAFASKLAKDRSFIVRMNLVKNDAMKSVVIDTLLFDTNYNVVSTALLHPAVSSAGVERFISSQSPYVGRLKYFLYSSRVPGWYAESLAVANPTLLAKCILNPNVSDSFLVRVYSDALILSYIQRSRLPIVLVDTLMKNPKNWDNVIRSSALNTEQFVKIVRYGIATQNFTILMSAVKDPRLNENLAIDILSEKKLLQGQIQFLSRELIKRSDFSRLMEKLMHSNDMFLRSELAKYTKSEKVLAYLIERDTNQLVQISASYNELLSKEQQKLLFEKKNFAILKGLLSNKQTLGEIVKKSI